MKIAIGADHGGYTLKTTLVEHLRLLGHDVADMGTDSTEPVDYPDIARRVAERLVLGRAERGILLCGSGVGAGIAANKIAGIRAAVCHDAFSARQGVEDDDMNLLCLGARVIGAELAKDLADVFLKARFSGAERHVRRLNKVRALEHEQECAEA
ncbi:MAG: ribose 5-phosphate isomerase B [Nitrospiraceae bacterium]|nr:ribose 5-phosphate isomerase B [Nitrospiraceae bacterium]